MVLRFFIILLALPLLPLAAGSQTRLILDDTLTFAFDEHVTVTAARLPVELSHAPAPVEVFDEAIFSRLPVSSISDILSLTAGASVRNYGAPGGLQLVSLRGIGAEYTLVYLDGIRLNDSQNSTVDLGRLSLRGIERVEIARGGFASLYGTNAVGGVINILSQRDAPSPSLQLGGGSFGWRLASFAAGIDGTAGRGYAEANYEEAENDYPVLPSWGGPSMNRGNASLLRKSVRAGGSLFVGSSLLSLHADAYDSRVGVPGPLFSSDQGRARQDDKQLLLSSRLSTRAFAGVLTIGAGTRLSTQNYRDPALSFNGVALDSRYDNTHYSLTSAWDGRFGSSFRLAIGAEAGIDRLVSAEVHGEPTRRQLAFFASGEWLLLPAGMKLHLYPSLRFDGLFDSPDKREWLAISPSLGMHLQLLPELLSLRMRAARNFGAPTFNQLYWSEGGNPDLLPESSTTLDAGVRIQTGGALEEVDITWFHHDITDKIVWMPGQGLWWSPRNVQHVVSNGIESSAGIAVFGDALRLRLTGQWISATKQNSSFAGDVTQGKQLVYVPSLSGSITVLAALTESLSLGATQRAVGSRYYTETNDASLPSFMVTDFSAQFRVPLAGMRLTMKAELFNAFDTSYEVIAFYPMPGRNVRGTLITEF